MPVRQRYRGDNSAPAVIYRSSYMLTVRRIPDFLIERGLAGPELSGVPERIMS